MKRPPLATPAPKNASASASASASTGLLAATVSIADPRNLRRELDARIQKRESDKGDDYHWLNNKNYPTAIGLMVDYLYCLLDHRKPVGTDTQQPETFANQSMIGRYRAFFSPGSLSFTFGMDVDNKNEPPSPHYHALEGQSILYVDWKLAFPAVELICYNCKHFNGDKRHLLHDRTNFSKTKNLFPIWTHSGVPTWCVAMKYKCECCKTTYLANDG